MKLKNITAHLLPLLLILSLVSSFFILKGCSSENSPVTQPSVSAESEAYAGKAATEIMKICCSASSYLAKIYKNQPLPQGSCPVITLDTNSKKIEIDYGPVPCVSSDDSVKRSGSYTINYFTNTGPDSAACKVTFTNYRIFSNPSDTNYLQISGGDDIGFRRIDTANYSAVYVLNNTCSRNGLQGDAVNFQLNTAVYTGTIGIITDDSYVIRGTGTVSDGSTSYACLIDSGNPLRFYGSCRYARYGIALLESFSKTFTLDFSPNSGGCDPFIYVTKDGITVIVNLELIN